MNDCPLVGEVGFEPTYYSGFPASVKHPEKGASASVPTGRCMPEDRPVYNPQIESVGFRHCNKNTDRVHKFP